MRRVFLCHPLNAETREGIELNRQAATEWAGALQMAFDISIDAMWIVLAGVWPEDAEHRARGINISLFSIRRSDELWLVGPLISIGMGLEASFALACKIPVFNLTGLSMIEVVQMTRAAIEERRIFKL